MKIIDRCAVVLLIVLSVGLFILGDYFTFRPWLTEEPLEWIGYASGNDEFTAIIADASETVAVINNEGELLYKVQAGNNTSKSFVSAELVELDAYNNLYVYDKFFGGAFEENTERILKYSPRGKFIDVIYSYSYLNEDFIITKGRISGMASAGDTLYLVRLEHDGFYLECIYTNEKNESQTQNFFAYPNAFREMSYCRLNTETRRIVWTTKAGTILEYSFSGSLIKSIPADDDMSPYMTASDNDGNIIYTDILNCEIARINASTGEKTALYNGAAEDGVFYYYINSKNNKIYASYGMDDVLVFNSDGEYTTFDSCFYSEDSVTIRYIYFSIVILAGIIFLFLFARGMLFLLKQKVSAVFKQILLIGLCIIFGASIASVIIIKEMQNANTENMFNELENFSRIITFSMDVDIVNSIRSPKDYNNEEFMAFTENIKTVFTEMEFSGKQVYLMLWTERDGVAYIMYDLEYCVGTCYPLGTYEGSYVEAAYSSERYQRFVERAASGTWQYVIGPVFDEDKNPIAAVEIGYNVRSVEESNRKMIIQVILIVIATTITFMLFIIECLLMLDAYNRNKNELTGSNTSNIKPTLLKFAIGLLLNAYYKEKEKIKAIPRHFSRMVVHSLFKTYHASTTSSFHPELIRAAAFFMYFSLNSATALLPIYAARLYVPVLNLPREIVDTLPFTTTVIFMVVAIILLPNILGRISAKKISLGFGILFFCGNIINVLAENVIHLSIGYALLGFACGAFGLLFNTMIAARDNAAEVNAGFAHLNASYLAGVNVGVVVGSIVAQFLSYRAVFWLASGIGLFFFLIIVFSTRSKLVSHYYNVHYVREKSGPKFALLKFFFKPVVLCTLFLALMPYVITLNFAEYFMPIFGMDNGLVEANIGQLMLLSGIFTILFGTSLCGLVRQKVPIQVVVFFSCLLNAAAMYLFSLNVSVSMLIITLLVIAVINIFALTNIQTYYTLLYQHENVASVQAFGMYSIIENISMAVGPIVFSFILANDIASGMKMLSYAILGATAIFTVTSGIYHKLGKTRGYFRRENDSYGAAITAKAKTNVKKDRR